MNLQSFKQASYYSLAVIFAAINSTAHAQESGAKPLLEDAGVSQLTDIVESKACV